MSQRYAVYARKSQEDEGRQIQSIENQLEETERFAIREGLAIVETIFESRSAWEPDNRPEFARLIEMVERGEVDGIVAWHPDRLSRNETDAATITRLLRKGILKSLKFVSYTFENSPEGIFFLQFALSQSQYQNSKMAVDVRRGMEKKRSDGWLPHRAPEGYLNDLETHTIVPDPVRFHLVRKGWDLLLGGQHTVLEVIDAMNAAGYRTKTRRKTGGGPLARTTGYRLFTNPFYAGWFMQKGQVFRGKHVSMVSDEEFELAQSLVRRKVKQRGTMRDHPYSGLIKCALCGGRASVELQRGAHRSGEYVYIFCTNRRCSRKSVRVDRFEIEIDRLLSCIEIDSETVRLTLDEVRAGSGVDDAERETVVASREHAIADAKQRIERLVDLLMRGIIDEEIYRVKQASLHAELRELEKSARNALVADRRGRVTVENGLQFAYLARKTFLTGGPAIRRRIVEALGITCAIRHGETLVELHPLFVGIVRRKSVHSEPDFVGSGKSKWEHFHAPILFGGAKEFVSELLEAARGAPPIADLTPFLTSDLVAPEQPGGRDEPPPANVEP